MLIATGVPTRTPVPGEPGEFISHVDLTVVGGSGKYTEATGTMTFDGRSHTATVPPTADLVYQGTVCGPNVKGGGTEPAAEAFQSLTVDAPGYACVPGYRCQDRTALALFPASAVQVM